MGPIQVNELSREDYHDKILESVKAQVKAIMEESVTRKFVHEENEHVLRLCIIIHTCLLDHLRKRTAGFLRSNKIANLFNKVGKSLPDIAQLVSKIEEAQSTIENQLSQNGKKEGSARPQSLQLRHLKYIWVRLTITERKLDIILEFLVDNCSKFYEKDSIFCDPVRGRILSSLLVGPCALEYTKMKTSDHYWSDPPADELLQRHRLGCRYEDQSPGRRTKLQSLSQYSSLEPTTKETGHGAANNFREYVESLHQNTKSTLLYGKNNVIVQPREEMKPIHGYLSLHQVLDSMFIKWTPNQMMNVNEQQKSVDCNHGNEVEENGHNDESRAPPVVQNDTENENRKRTSSYLRRSEPNDDHNDILSYWEYAISVNVKDVVYLHCHQRNDAKGTLVLVGQDGVQRPPICFPPGGHLLAFLTCLETGLLPLGHLDPPLWLQRGKGKVFPKLRNRSSQSSTSSGSIDVMEATDFVFRVTSGGPKPIPQPIADIQTVQENFDAYEIGPEYSCYKYQPSVHSYSSRSSLKVLCHTMRQQIISRAFYGWIAHCRHLSTVRTHLSALILPDSSPLPMEQASPIDMEVWNTMLENGKLADPKAFMKRVYFGGIKHKMRKYLWPFLLEHYPIDSNHEERERIDDEALKDYERVVSEWKVAENIVVRRQKESLAAKLSCDSRTSSTSSLDCSPKQPMHGIRKQSTMSDVFVSLEHDGTNSMNVNSSSMDSSHEKSPRGQATKTRHAMKDKHKGDSKLTNDHTPYSSLSTEYSNAVRRHSSTTISSSILDATGESMNDEMRLGDIIESHQEGEPTKDKVSVSESDSESRSPNHKTPLMKQDGIDMGISLEQGLSQDIDEVSKSNEKECPGYELSDEILESFSINLHRIEKDVHRCDRNHEYFTSAENLQKLQNIMCSYVWRHLDFGYMQGMCDLAAPLLLLIDDESKVFSCFTQLMKRMENNFPNGQAMDAHFANMRSLIQVLDSDLFQGMHQKGNYTHFYFCYRWFLLDFKRELSYDNDVFSVWETIWAARHVCSEQFVLFFALALLHNYRDIILDNEMDFTDIIKFFNEMAERHDAGKILKLAQSFVFKVQSMISK